MHTVIDDHSRVAYAEIHDDETAATAVGVLRRAVSWFAARGVTVERVLSDNGSAYKSHLWRDTCAELGITAKKTRPYRPQTNGKIERFHRTLADGWAFTRFYATESARRNALPAWLHDYNHHRPHTAIGKATHQPVDQPGWAVQLAERLDDRAELHLRLGELLVGFGLGDDAAAGVRRDVAVRRRPGRSAARWPTRRRRPLHPADGAGVATAVEWLELVDEGEGLRVGVPATAAVGCRAAMRSSDVDPSLRMPSMSVARCQRFGSFNVNGISRR